MADAPEAGIAQRVVSEFGGTAAGRVSLRSWLVELAPIVVTLALVWAKLVYASAFVRSEWWSNTTSIGQWMRPSRNLAEIITAHPAIATGTLACLLIAVGALALIPRGWRLLALLALNVGLTVLALADLLHVRFYGDVLSTGSFTTPRMVKDITPSILDIAKGLDPIYGMDLAPLALAAPAALVLTWRVPRLDTRPRVRLAGLLLVLGLVMAVPMLATRWQQADVLFSPGSPRIEAASVVGVLPYHVLEIVTPRGSVTGEADNGLSRVGRFLAEERQRQGAPSPLFGVARGANVILMSAESLQSFPIGLEIDGQPVMPNLAAFARESLSFPNYHEQTYLGTTSDAQFGVLQSLHPRPVGFVAMDHAGNEYRALPGVLAELGYATFAAVAAPGEFWNAERLNPRYGFERSYFEDEFDLTEHLGAWLADDAFFRQMMPRLEGSRQPFMAYLLSSSNHHPFELPHQYQTLNIGQLQGTLLGDYLQSAHLFDQAFGGFIARLRAAGLLDRTVFVMYGDHQGFLGDPPELARLLGRPSWGEYDRFYVRKRVPLIVRLPGGAHAGERAIVGGHLDVAPTILSLLGIEDEAGVMLGRDLTRERPSLVVFRDGSFADDTHYYVQRFGAEVGAACYEIATGRPVDCSQLETQRRAARERLEVSDLIVQGNLIPGLRGIR